MWLENKIGLDFHCARVHSVGVVVEQFRGARMKIRPAPSGYVFDLVSGFVLVFVFTAPAFWLGS